MMVDQAEDTAVRQSVVVQAPAARAFEVFTDGMSTWWPLASHSIGSAPMVAAVIEPRAGGRWYERGEDGSECDWGEVLVWEPPHRLVLKWQLTADYAFDADLHTEIEVRFHAEDANSTRVELEHRGLDAYGERTAEMRETFGSDGGWAGLLRSFADAAAR
jgi:uncharacterized protein YndB with AHSA1/START domain